MCRFTLYLGPPIRLDSLLITPTHSLIRQSTHSHEREEPLNGDGFGVGWYARHFTGDPAVFRSITPAWNNRNLHNIARIISSDCILAHVRAATQFSGVNEANCHPFRYQQYLFMHNGDIGNFHAVRRPLINSVCDEAFSNIFGSTDSEYFFAVLIDEILHGSHTGDPSNQLASALDRTIVRVVETVAEHGAGESSYLNCAVSDGTHAVVSRFANDKEHLPESLYYFLGDLYPRAEIDETRENGIEERSVIVSSERLTQDAGWETIPPNHLTILRRNRLPELRPCSMPSPLVN
ncbi:MAG: Glutamine amidotransferase type-2 protein [Gammaproteobacteria bacterium]|nr:Glutamine amidotransferase type-2 protein [Gammaproteobacteria bacterium]